MSQKSELTKLKNKIKQLKIENADLQETLRVIQKGEVDALVVAGPLGDRIFTLQSAEQPYRELVEAMNEGALTVSPDGIILYSNQRFQSMTGVSYQKLIGSDLRAHVRPESRRALEILFSKKKASNHEILLHVDRKNPLPVQLSVSPIELSGSEGYCIIATDLSAQKQSTLLFQQQEWLGTLLNLLPVPLVLLEGPLNECNFVNAKASEILYANADAENDLPAQPNFLIFENEEGHFLELETLLKQIKNNQTRTGIETILMAGKRKIPVLLFSDTLPAMHGREPAKLLMFQDISEIKKAQNELSIALRGRDQFLAALSHELRTPLNVILGWVQLLRENPKDETIVRQALDTLERNADLQRDLIEDLLDMSRILTGNLVVHLRPLDLKSAVKDALTSLQVRADEAEVKIKIEFDNEPIIVVADEKRIQQLVSNLLHNAIKFSPKKSEVTVKIQRNNVTNFASLIVKDQGRGIEPSFIPQVFDQFKQENMATNRSYGGLGLGLAICKTIVDQHHGEISVSSEGRDRGAVFTVFLPLCIEEQRRVESVAQPVKNKIRLNGLRVLVVDDSTDNLSLFRIWLKETGADVKTLSSAAGVLDALKEFKPHVLLSDISMPGEDGFSLISRVRNLPAKMGGNIPAGAITANARVEDKNQTIAAGFNVHISKPVTSYGLIAAVKSLADIAQF